MTGTVLMLQAGSPIPSGSKLFGTSEIHYDLPNGESRVMPVSVVGFGLVPGIPAKVSLVAPKTIATSTTPTLIWNGVGDATYYLLRVTPVLGATVERWYLPGQISCPGGYEPCTVVLNTALPPGRATWQVLGWSPAGYGPWSDLQEFSIDVADPALGTPVPLSPTGNAALGVAFTWTPVAGATSYRLSIRQNGGAAAYSSFWPVAAGCQAASPCTGTPAAALQIGTMEWQVQAWTASGYGPWSTPVVLSVGGAAPSSPTLVSPAGSATSLPVFVWNAATGTTLYVLRVNSGSANSTDRWVKPADVGCGAGTGTCSLTSSIALTSGSYTWQVLAWNSLGYSQWSTAKPFTVP